MSTTLAAAATTGDGSFERTYADRWTPMVKLAALTTGSVAIAEEIVHRSTSVDFARWIPDVRRQ